MEENGLNLYLQEMWYVKKRTEAIRTIALKEKTTLFPITNIEFMTLQIRKIIEHIAMGNLIANKCLLSKLKTLDFTDFCPIFWYNDCKDFDKNKSFFLQFSYRF